MILIILLLGGIQYRKGTVQPYSPGIIQRRARGRTVKPKRPRRGALHLEERRARAARARVAARGRRSPVARPYMRPLLSLSADPPASAIDLVALRRLVGSRVSISPCVLPVKESGIGANGVRVSNWGYLSGGAFLHPPHSPYRPEASALPTKPAFAGSAGSTLGRA